MIMFMSKENSENRKVHKICITNRHLVEKKDSSAYLSRIEEACRRKPDTLILREKDLSAAAYQKLAEQVGVICGKYGVEFIINYFVNVAIDLGVDKVHLSFSDYQKLTDAQKKLFGKTGVSIHSIQEAAYAERSGVNYIIAGHIFDTDCKKGVPARGTQFLRDVCREVQIPVYAIGGIHEDNIQECMNAGAYGVCMMSEYMKQLQNT